MTNEEAIDIIKCLAWHTRPNEEDIEQAIEALKQPSYEDCISREAVLDIWHTRYSNIREENEEIQYKKIAFELPSVTPKQKVGKWIKTYEPNDAEPCILWECSECKNVERGKRSKYCPNCGTKMEVEE